MKKPVIKRAALLTLFAFAFIVPIFSQPPPPPPTSSVGSPIEGGLIYLLALGVGYGIRKLRGITN